MEVTMMSNENEPPVDPLVHKASIHTVDRRKLFEVMIRLDDNEQKETPPTSQTNFRLTSFT